MACANILHPTMKSGWILLVVGLFCQQTIHAVGDVWQWLNPYPTGNPVDGVTFVNGRFAVCSGSRVSTSQDGSNWVTHLIPGDSALTRIAYGGGIYVTIGSKPGAGVIVTSTNLSDWTVQTSGTSNALRAIVYGNGLFVVTGGGGTILTSTNGSDWIARSSGTSGPLTSIAFGNGVFVAVAGTRQGQDSSASVSSDGIVWTRQNIGGDLISTVNYARGLFHAGGYLRNPFPPYPSYSATLYLSTDGTNWTPASFASDAGTVVEIRTVFADTNSFYAVDNASYPNTANLRLLKSSNGTNFSLVNTVDFVGTDAANGYASGNGLLMGANEFIQVSANGTNWTTVNGPTPFLTDIAYGNGAYVAVGGGFALPSGSGSVGSGSIVRSSGRLPFESQASPVEALLCRVLFADGLFHCVGYSGTILRSTNGTQWVQRTSATGNHLRSLCHGNGLWVAVGDNGTVVTSPNGLVWTLRFSGVGPTFLNGVAYGSNTFVAVGGQGTVITSSTAADWTVQFADTTDTFFDITFGNGQFVAVGANGVVMTSADGVNWITGDSGTSSGLHGVAFANGTFVAAGSPNDCCYGNVLLDSTNGLAWVPRYLETSFRFYGVRSVNNTFLVVGDHGTILQSASPGSIWLEGNWNSINQQFDLSINGGLGQSFRVQSSDSASPTSWADRVAFTNAPNPVTFSDPTSPSQPTRFYRVVGQ